MTQINAYLRFNGNCAEAMTFYKECLGGVVKLMTVGESPMASQMPAAQHKNIMHATLVNKGIMLMGSDMTGPDGVMHGNAISLTVVCSSKTEIETFFAKLSAGGKVMHALKEEFFGTHGDLTDKFGLSWMFNYEKPKA
jgi:PhnB protein